MLGALGLVSLRGLANDVYCQIGLVMLIGLSAKNSILIVEFAEQLRRKGRSIAEAAIEAAELRLRPILMTSFAFILGVLPLVFATGAGALGRRSVGTTVVGGMLLSTVLNLFFIPVLYVLLSRLLRSGDSVRMRRRRHRTRSLLVAVGDHVVLDAVVDLHGDDAAVEQVSLGVVGPEAHDAAGPTGRHAGTFSN
jgi:predicted RND superfamily exporter protein